MISGTPQSTAVASRRELIEAEDFHRRRGVAALERGDTLAVEDVPRRPNASLVAGLVLVLLIAAGSAITAFLTDRAPDDWLADGTLVVDEGTGARYLARSGTLLPTPSVTAAVLSGARPEPVLVPHARVVGAPVGLPLRDTGAPESPPAVPPVPTVLTACLTGDAAVDVFAGRLAGQRLATTGMLVRPRGSDEVRLLDRQRAFPLDPGALVALGYASTQVRDVPADWLDLVPPGPRLAPVGVDPDAEVVATTGGGRYVLQGGRARPAANATSARLLPPPSRTLADAAVAAMPAGDPVGVLDAPSEPPTVPAPEEAAVPCVFGGGSPSVRLGYAASADDGPGTRPAPTRRVTAPGGPLEVTWHLAPGEGALVGPLELNQRRPAEEADLRDAGMTLVAGGVGYPVLDQRTLQRLGYRRDQIALLPGPWLELIAPGAPLAAAAE